MSSMIRDKIQVCPVCSTENEEGSDRCVSCGFSLDVKSIMVDIDKPMTNESNHCIQCGSEFKQGAKFCLSCGYNLESSPPVSASYPDPYDSVGSPPYQVITPEKNKVVAGLLALFLGSFGAHRFYLGQIGTGFLYLALCWTGISTVVGIVEGIMILTCTDDEFQQKYVNRPRKS